VQAETEDELLRRVATENAKSILVAHQRAEEELLRAKEALERKTEELARSLSMMRATLESTTDGILVTDAAGNVTGCNQRYEQMWGIPRAVMEAGSHQQLVEKNSRQFADPAAFCAQIHAVDDNSHAETFDLLSLADGRTLELFTKLQLVDGQIVGRVWSFRDITERRRTEDALRAVAIDNARLYEAAQTAAEERTRLLESERVARNEAERMSQMKDEFLASLSHELRTPLSAILGWTHILRRGAKSPADVERGISTIERNARIQAQLIEDLLDMSRITSGKLRLDVQSVEPAAFIESAVETMRPAAEAKGIRLEKILDPAAGPISGDPSRLQQIVWNLLSNAIKFTPKAGSVQVVLQRVESHIEIHVADTGMGIKQEFLAHVFDRFRQADASSTRSFGGLGLGLAIVKQLVEMHGGTVVANSDGEGRGATFSVRLPLVAVNTGRYDPRRVSPKTALRESTEFPVVDLSGIRILVVDDEADGRDLVKRVLEGCGAEVFTAGAADEALAMLERERPQLLVSDIGMPQVDGFELLRRIRALGPDKGGQIRAIALTAFARAEDRTQALHGGFVVHVSKPVEPFELIATVASVAGRAGGSLK
jgi:PAS domain S-box-containing protein